MEYAVCTEGPYTIIALTGEIDLHVSPQARKQILDNLREKRHVLVDLSAVEYMDSSGIASLIEGLRFAKSNNLEFGLIGVSTTVMQVLQLTRLDKIFAIHDSVSGRLSASK